MMEQNILQLQQWTKVVSGPKQVAEVQKCQTANELFNKTL